MNMGPEFWKAVRFALGSWSLTLRLVTLLLAMAAPMAVALLLAR